MTRVPGLRPFTEDRATDLTRSTGRVMVEEPSSKRRGLDPKAAPVDTYSRPGRAPIDNRFGDFIEALTPLNPALARFAEVTQTDQKEEDDAYWKRTAASSTVPEIEAKLKDGSDPRLTSIVRSAKGQELFANRVAAQDVQDAFQEYQNSADRDTLSIDEFIAKKQKARLDQFGGNKHFTNAYVAAAGPGFEKIRAGHAQYLTERQKTEQLDGASATFGNIIQNGKDTGKTPEQIGAAIWGEVKGNKLTLNLPQPEQDKLILQHAQGLAEKGEYDTVKALLATKRTDREGRESSLLDNRATSVAASTMLQKAEQTRNENNRKGASDRIVEFHRQAYNGTLDSKQFEEFEKANPGAFTPQQRVSILKTNSDVIDTQRDKAEKLEGERSIQEKLNAQDQQMETEGLQAIQQGTVNRLGPRTVYDKKGETEEWDAKKVREQAETTWLNKSGLQAQKAKETPEQQFQRELPTVSLNGMTNPAWKKTFAAGAAAMSIPNLTADKLPPALAEGLAMYTEMRAKAPHLLGSHLGSEQRDLYETVSVLTQDMGMETSRALMVANEALRDPKAADSPVNRAKADDIRSKVKSLNTYLPSWLGGDAAIANGGAIAQQIEKRANILARAGVDVDEALKRSAQSISQTHTNINGFMVPTNGARIPQGFADKARVMLRGYANHFGKAEGLDAGDLSMMPAGAGTDAWIIWNKKTNSPVFDRDNRTFTLREIEQLAEHERQKAAATVEAVGAARQKNNLKPADQRQLPVFGGGFETPLDRQLKEPRQPTVPAPAAPVVEPPPEGSVPEAIPPGGRYFDPAR